MRGASLAIPPAARLKRKTDVTYEHLRCNIRLIFDAISSTEKNSSHQRLAPFTSRLPVSRLWLRQLITPRRTYFVVQQQTLYKINDNILQRNIECSLLRKRLCMKLYETSHEIIKVAKRQWKREWVVIQASM